MKKFIAFFLFFGLFTSVLCSQTYPPAAGLPGSTAIHADSAIFKSWATGCKVIRGYQDISNPGSGYASFGDSAMALGKGLTNGVVSLGDGGKATCTFQNPIKNGPGFDFAVFENSIDGAFLELAFVEVSSDGVNFFRFNSNSLTDTNSQTGSFASTDPTRINNLAGKYKVGYGTPFDLQELASNPGINVNAVTHVRVIDVIGSINNAYATRDFFNNKINDPWPTAFPSSGFDLDAIGVINEVSTTDIDEQTRNNSFLIFPNPLLSGDLLTIKSDFDLQKIEVVHQQGGLVFSGNAEKLETRLLEQGIYMVKIFASDKIFIKKLVVL